MKLFKWNINFDRLRELWRPIAAVTYLVINVCDFIIFPVLWSYVQIHFLKIPMTPWDPITLKSGAYFHVAFMTILGAAAYTRGMEKIESIKQGTKERISQAQNEEKN